LGLTTFDRLKPKDNCTHRQV